MTHAPRDLALTFAGGGNRAFYQMGLLARWWEALSPRVGAIASCSAGACVITTWLSGRRETARAFWMGRREGITKNFRWENLLRPGARIAPQGEIYRATMLHTFADGGFERVRASPFPIYVVASAFPSAMPAGAAVALGMSVYSAERAWRTAIHPRFTKAVGFRPFVRDARECESAEELADLILASSATPPFTPIGRFRGTRLLDGGMVDNVPAFAAEAVPGIRRNVVFLTRPYAPQLLGIHGDRLYLAPTRETPITRWDYTQPHLLDETIVMGEREADVHRPLLDRFLSTPA
ncbi:MAG: putative esterase of the alpha-beta hydrolase superfamily [Gemmatimonadetes bacterium]|nr:putative esterase of the alpha-beta hydrolase superfamily [Gemmatimonadota bacterium]